MRPGLRDYGTENTEHKAVGGLRTIYRDSRTGDELGRQLTARCSCGVEFVVGQKLKPEIQSAFDAQEDIEDCTLHFRMARTILIGRVKPLATERVLRVSPDVLPGKASRPLPLAALAKAVFTREGVWPRAPRR